jgi:hypothetical protein
MMDFEKESRELYSIGRTGIGGSVVWNRAKFEAAYARRLRQFAVQVLREAAEAQKIVDMDADQEFVCDVWLERRAKEIEGGE